MSVRTMASGLAVPSALAAALASTRHGAETPKRGGTLTYMIPADAPPSFDGHRETTYATVHAAAPFYSVLIRVNPDNPASTTDFVCDLCTEMPQADRRRQDLHLQDPQGRQVPRRHAADRAGRGGELATRSSIRRKGVTSARESYFAMVDTVEAPDAETVVFKLKFATTAFLPALADPFAYIYKKEILDKDPHWYEKNIMGSGPFKFVELRGRPVDQGRAQPRLLSQGPALSRRLRRRSSPPSRRCASTRSAPTAPRSSSAACRRRRATSWSRSWATRSRCRRATGTAATC